MFSTIDRRTFTAGLAGAAFAALARVPADAAATAPGYGPLRADPTGLLDLPDGFHYKVISRFGDRMDDGFTVGDRADGMGCIPLGRRRVALVRNHELQARHHGDGPFARTDAARVPAYDRDTAGRPLPGGTSTIVYDFASGKVERQYLSLAGTIRNCAGGTTPWGSWLSCEEDVTRAGAGVARDHGWVFEVPARHRGLVDPVPLKAMGRFNHEAAAVDPRTGIVYLTEDREDGLLYRFLPDHRGQLARGGRLQALGLRDRPEGGDTSNKLGSDVTPGAWKAACWIDLDGVEAPDDDLRLRGYKAGAARFARGEGIHWGIGEGYFCCTSGGAAGLGQVMRYRPSPREGQPGEVDAPGMLQLFVESTDPAMFNFGDNLTVGPNGHLIVCEDQYTDVVDNHLRGVTPDGRLYPVGRCRLQTELAGACFSPDGSTLFVNLYSPATTLAISGPWRRL
ncbi:alkaline phosphatase PhoX [Sphingomonas koreensis]|uniref:alkaline phosphatase PhoX n=1 Tax=Sphingomonas koreensis TaxID=93064 RepID=UPI001F49BC66|nr:alkaline phosphatase PhoX [Sphingomonas koreensis]